mmetsp:Transcript_15861/g.42846  ORF Transcript_15861/g.42846 Transcript_15861/m.42846 type:complete len:365 (+) Transcript_15861:1716-2810(+)
MNAIPFTRFIKRFSFRWIVRPFDNTANYDVNPLESITLAIQNSARLQCFRSDAKRRPHNFPRLCRNEAEDRKSSGVQFFLLHHRILGDVESLFAVKHLTQLLVLGSGNLSNGMKLVDFLFKMRDNYATGLARSYSNDNIWVFVVDGGQQQFCLLAHFCARAHNALDALRMHSDSSKFIVATHHCQQELHVKRTRILLQTFDMWAKARKHNSNLRVDGPFFQSFEPPRIVKDSSILQPSPFKLSGTVEFDDEVRCMVDRKVQRPHQTAKGARGQHTGVPLRGIAGTQRLQVPTQELPLRLGVFVVPLCSKWQGNSFSVVVHMRGRAKACLFELHRLGSEENGLAHTILDSSPVHTSHLRVLQVVL